jgi:starch phosphorylase
MVIANFVMEIGLESEMPTYGGGLGVLAGDFALSLADLGIPAVFVTLLYRKGYASQSLDRAAGQLDSEAPMDPGRFLTPLQKYVDLEMCGRPLRVKAWEYRAKGKGQVPVLFLDTDDSRNDSAARQITHRLYGGDPWYRLEQEMVLGIAGYRMLKALDYNIDVYHLNESHAALLVVELLREYGKREEVRKKCVFTAHTPVPAGYDAFPLAMIKQVFEHYDRVDWDAEATEGRIDLARLALKYSGVTNAVSLKHRYVSERVLEHNQIVYVTNGVHHRRWIHDELKKVYNKHLPGWEETPSLLSGAFNVPSGELASGHAAAKSEMVDMLNNSAPQHFDRDSLTIGLAKRVTAYKRNNLILAKPGRLVEIAEKYGAIQLVFAGKAHPRDDVGKAMIRDIILKGEELRKRSDKVRVVYLENYDIDIAKSLVAGCDLWLNTPRRPLEACGTSGMKAAMNGVLNFSVYDGWWLEGGIEGVNGWGIGKRAAWLDFGEGSDSEDLEDLYGKLSGSILPAYYQNREKWWEMAKNSIATVTPLFNAYRMVENYIARVYSKSRANQ